MISPIDRVDKFACRNCKKSGHSSRECPEPRSAENVECKRCNESKWLDCTTNFIFTNTVFLSWSLCKGVGSDVALLQNVTDEFSCPSAPPSGCRNCDEIGHVGKDCPKPRDCGYFSSVMCVY